ncbi:MAG: hypothetical protein ACRDFX_05905 [Chloroflexota bacterium]
MNIRSGNVAAGALVIATLSVASVIAGGGGAAPTDASSLLASAVRNTNHVRTLVHHDTIRTTVPRGTISSTITGREDEVANREDDIEHVTVHLPDSKGTLKTLHYTIEVIFLHGKTYARSSLAGNTWKSGKGMTFVDPFTGGFRRGRTKMIMPKGGVRTIGKSGSTVHVRGTYVQGKSRGPIDVWYTTGSVPYVSRERYAVTRGSGAKHQVTIIDTHMGPFNQAVVIQPPGGTST